MSRIDQLNTKYEDKLQPYQRVLASPPSIINKNLGYFLPIGLGYVVITMTGSFGSGDTSASSGNLLVGILALAFALLIYIGLTAWQVNLYRAVLEKQANKAITLTRSSFIPNFNKEFFNRGWKFILASLVYGLLLGFVLVGLILLIALVAGVGLVTQSTLSIFLILSLVLACLALGLLVSPFILPLATLYVYYGDDLGVIESLKLSFTLGKNHYFKLLTATIKIFFVKLLGILLFLVGYVYTSVWAIMIELDTVSEILNVSLKEGQTFEQ